MAENLISAGAAKALITAHTEALSPVELPITVAGNTVLAANVYAAINMPPFNQSAMDGYAFCFADYEPGKALTVSGESAAGSNLQTALQKNMAVRIFTGAPVPVGADTVVMQEQTNRSGNRLMIESPGITCGLNVRNCGADTKQGSLALESGTLLTPAAVGFLAGIGVSTVWVHKFPRVSIITTGKELVQPGHPLNYGQVYESNSVALKTALQQVLVPEITVIWVDDDVEQLVAAIQQALQQSDLILITGGVSVGDYDFVIPALDKCAVESVFHKVKQRPGKPLYFGKKSGKVILGLPGNPSSVLSCYYNYALPAIQLMMRRTKPFIETKQLPLENAFTKNTTLTHFLKGSATSNKVTHLTAQESFRLSSFALANCLIEIPAETQTVLSGEMVTVHLLG